MKPLSLGLIALTTSILSVSISAHDLFPRDPQHSKRGHEDAQYLRRSIERREFSLIDQDSVLKSYDYIIAGGGLAGLVLASRLSEDSKRSVLVLEAGLSGDEVKARVDSPAGAYYQSIVGSDYDWKYFTANQPDLNNRVVPWPRGKILGGSTAMNAMYLVRPSRTEIDSWSQLLASSEDSDVTGSASRWNWDTLFAAMKKSENFTAPTEEAWMAAGNFSFDSTTHGSGGPMSLSYPEVMFEIVGNWTTALDRAGIAPLESPNGGITLGGFISPSSINPTNLTRSYSRPAYIDSLPPRSNLHILPQATVTKIGFSDSQKASGNALIANTIEFARDSASTRYVVGVDREVILAGGPLGSPKVLLHSGVGPTDVLQQIGIDVVNELPGVGQNLQDHVAAGVVWESRLETAGDVRATGSDFSNSAPFLSFINDAVAFVNASLLFGTNADVFQQQILAAIDNSTSGVPSTSSEVQAGFRAIYNLTATTFWRDTAQLEILMSVISPGTITIQGALQHPFSRGRVYINSTDPFDPIVIDPQYFSHSADRTILRQGIKLVRQIGVAFGDSLGAEVSPGSGVQSDEDIDSWLTNQGAGTQYHPASSCSMLPKKWGGVVDADLKVYGLANVRVVDSSVYPYEFAAHLASATYGLAEVGSGVVAGASFEVPSGAKPDTKTLGRQGSGGGSSNGSGRVVSVRGSALVGGLVGIVFWMVGL